MSSTGIGDPVRDFRIAAAIAAAGAAGIGWGAGRMLLTGSEPFDASLALGLGLPVGVIGAALAVNFRRAVAFSERLRRGEGVIARWRVSAAALDTFAAAEDAARKAGAAPNEFRVPKNRPADGMEVVFGADSALIGRAYFGLPLIGIVHLRGVSMRPGNPPALVFDLGLAAPVQRGERFTVQRSRHVLRVPVAATAEGEAAKVRAHFEKVLRREVLVRPEFWRSRIRIGLVGAAVFAAVAAAGFSLNALGLAGDVLPLALAVIGVVAALGGLVLAGLAALLGWKQRKG